MSVRDETAILHLPRGMPHLASMELRRLSKLHLPLKKFHSGILLRLIQLNQQEVVEEEGEYIIGSGKQLWLEVVTPPSEWRCVVM